MSNELYADWLKSLKAGDKVAYSFRGIITIDKVKKITPKGIIRLESGESADIFGNRMRPNAYGDSFQIEPLTPEIGEKVVKMAMARKIEKYPFYLLSKEQLEMIVEIIEVKL